MKIAVTGASGLIGSAVVRAASDAGHEVLTLVRREPRTPSEVSWDPAGGKLDPASLDGVDGVVHLAGAGVGDHRWTPEYKRTIRDSRVLGTRTLVTALAALDGPAPVLVSGSAIGVYGDRGDEDLTEDSEPGTGFLADVVKDWEAEAARASEAGSRVVMARTGLVVSPKGGAFGRLLPLVRLGLGGPLGSGRQWWSWITLVDEVAALLHLLEHPVEGPVNLTAPSPARNVDLVRALAEAAHRPALVPAPAFALRAALGEFADDILSSQKVLPKRLLGAGFAFSHPQPADAAHWVLDS
ncbi:MAG: TIGR01777 family oxidoreductase [Kineosporiaceae bacterium]